MTIALAKGRLLEPSLEILRKAGIWEGEAAVADGLVLERNGIRIIVIRDDDVATYVASGASDMGIVGKDILLEQQKDVVEIGDLGVGVCRLVVAAPEGFRGPSRPVLRVASKYVLLAEQFLLRKGCPFQVIKVHGSTELAPSMGLADAIVDLVQTGETLKRNGLVEIEEIMRSSARLIVNPASYTMKQEKVASLASSITAAASSAGPARDRWEDSL
ncbi:MAG: ATP phosphoribosyltransferase [Bacillota bacterium]